MNEQRNSPATALDATKLLRDYDRELTVKQRAAIADILDDYADGVTEISGDLVTALIRFDENLDRLRMARDALRKAEIHLEADWCWCNPVRDSENHWIHITRASSHMTKYEKKVLSACKDRLDSMLEFTGMTERQLYDQEKRKRTVQSKLIVACCLWQEHAKRQPH